MHIKHLIAAALLTAGSAMAQEAYRFRATDYTRLTDRVQASQISYDEEANTFTITATGQNNVAFGMDKSHDGEWYFLSTQNYLAIEGQNLGSADKQSYIWWFNGFNNASSVAPDYAVKQDDGSTLLVWNLRTAGGINGNLNWQSERITLTSGGAQLAQAIGLTAASSKGATITDIDFYDRYQLAVAHPAMLKHLGYADMDALVAEVKGELQAVVDQAREHITADSFDATDGAALQTAYDRALELLAAAEADLEAIVAHKSVLAQAIKKYVDAHPVSSWKVTATGIEAKWNDMTTTIMLYDDRTVRVYKSLVTRPEDKRSLPVVMQCPSSAYFNATEQDGIVTVLGSNVAVTYNLQTTAVSVSRTNGTAVLAEADYGTTFAERMDGPYDSYTVEQRFTLDPDEAIYGLGQIQNGHLNQRGQSTKLEQNNTKVCIPYWQSSRAYGFYWDNYSPTTYTDSKESTLLTSTGTEVDYYVLVADDAQGVLPLVRNLTGHAPMMPLWNFGLYQSKERYTSSDEVRDVLRRYRELQVPLDCMVQDWQYWGEDNNNWNALAFQNPKYADGEQMIKDVHDMNAKLMISIWANFGPASAPYKELERMGRLMDVGRDGTWPRGYGVRPYDAYDAAARDVYWKYLYNGLVTKGVDSYWMDSTEPDYYNGSDRDYDFDYVSGEGRTWRSLRNAFPLCHVMGAYDHHRAQQATDAGLAKKRVSILTRSGYVGQQRYAAYTWSGDISSSWETLANQIPAALCFSACGIPYWNADNGGFFPNSGGVNDSGWRQLYMRWTQFSTFTPMMRFHGTGTPREIYQFGDATSGDFKHILKYIKLRYRLLPYLYSTAHSVTVDDATFMQALPIAFEHDADCFDVKDEYMFGRAFLVCPVLQAGVNHREVYLPACRWVDFWTGATVEGGQTVNWTGAMEQMPLYVRAGSILPWGPDVQYSGEKPWDELEVRVYPGADGTFTLYEDAGDGYEYEQGEYTEVPFAWDDATSTLTIGARRGAFPTMLQKRTFRLCRVSPFCAAGDEHEADYVEVEYDGSELKVELPEQEAPATETVEDITAQYVKNPSFEADGRTLTKQAPKNWKVDCSCSWWGINNGGGNGDPEATDGRYIFGVWDGGNTARATISQVIKSLPAGTYRLTVDMHASSTAGACRVGQQCVFAGDNVGLFRDQVLTEGTGDNIAMQTIAVDFEQAEAADVTIGVTTSGAPSSTWFKIDNFRLYRVTPATPDAVSALHAVLAPSATYTLGGVRIDTPRHAGIYINSGRKIVIK